MDDMDGERVRESGKSVLIAWINDDAIQIFSIIYGIKYSYLTQIIHIQYMD